MITTSARLVVRRAWRDRWLLLAATALVASSAAMAAVGPRMVLDTLDAGAQDAVAATTPAIDLRSSVADYQGATTPTVSDFLAAAEVTVANLPPAITAVLSDAQVSVTTSPSRALLRDGERESVQDADGEVAVQATLLTTDRTASLTRHAGVLPSAVSAGPVPVVVSEAGATAANLEVGTRLALDAAWAADGRLEVEVVGIVAGEPDAWDTAPGFWEPAFREALPGRPAYTRITVATDQIGLARLSAALDTPGLGTIRLHVDPQAFGLDVAAEVAAELGELGVSTSDLGPIPLTLRTDLDEALVAYPPQARAALAQMSVMIAGVVAVAALVLVLMGRLIVQRRTATIGLERARGASVAAVALRLLAESAVVAAVGVLSALAVTGSGSPGVPTAVVAVTALFATPLQGAVVARRAWTGVREPANRADRALLARRRATRRLVAEAGALVLAAAAVASLRARGLLQTTTQQIDPFLAAAPALLAVAATVLVLRAYPGPLHLVAAAGRRTRGPLGLLGAVRARRVAALPLLALTLGAAVAVSGGMLVATVRDGQVTASWERVGADLRLTGEFSPEEIEALAQQPGVTSVAAAAVATNVPFSSGVAGGKQVTLLAVDDQFADLVAEVPGGAVGDLGELGPAEEVAVVADADLAAQVVGSGTALYFAGHYVPVTLVGATDHRPRGYLPGPYLYVDLAALGEAIETDLTANTIWVLGDGGEAAVAAVGIGADSSVSRAQWLQARRDLALHHGVAQMMIAAMAAAALLCAVALAATVLAGSRERGRTLSLLRTLGMRSGLGWWLALAELVPVVLAAILGGVVSGAVVVVVLAPALGLDVLAGGLGLPEPTISPAVAIGLAGAGIALLLMAVAVEVAAHRRDRLSEVLRVGETA